MYRIKVLPITTFILCILIFCAYPCCFAQSNYPEIELYRSLVEKETRDSSYHKALAQYQSFATMHPMKSASELQRKLTTTLLLPENTDSEVIKKTEILEALAQEAAQKRDHNTELSALCEAFFISFWHEPKNYSKAFVLAIRLKNKLQTVDNTQFPGRKDAYVKLGQAYYIFKDYEKSIELLANVINEPPISSNNNGLVYGTNSSLLNATHNSFKDNSHLEALRISGICYANIPGKMQQSDSCFMAMLLCPDMVLHRPIYNAHAISNLGCNAMMKGEFDKALSLDLEVLSLLKQEKDYGHIAGMYACQGFCYLGMGDYDNLKIVIDSILTYAHKDYYNRNKRLKQAYTLSGKYYSATGNAQMAQQYNDSLVEVYKTEEHEYTSQFISDARREQSEQEIAQQKQEIAHQKNLVINTLFILVVVSIGMIVILHLYRKRNAAYKVLARKAEIWAREVNNKDQSLQKEKRKEVSISDTTEDNAECATITDAGFCIEDMFRFENSYNESASNNCDCPTDEDYRIMELIEYEITVNQIYRQADLTAELLANHLEVHRNVVSHAVNRITGVNFKNYINGYRIKEAVRIISQTNSYELNINELYEQVGFGNRTSFYRSFKKFTGLSPIEYHRNK